MRIAICDDEILFAQDLKQTLNICTKKNASIDVTAEVITIYTQISALFADIADEDNPQIYDLIFMDIDWSKESETGIDFAARLFRESPGTQIIFVTGYNDRFSQEIFFQSTNLCGYLVKPVQEDKLAKLLHKASTQQKARESQVLSITSKNKTDLIAYADILYLESRGHQIYIHTISDAISVPSYTTARATQDTNAEREFGDTVAAQYILYGKLDEFEKKLNSSFVRCHKSYLVNLAYIKHIERVSLTLHSGKSIPISKRNIEHTKQAFFTHMKQTL